MKWYLDFGHGGKDPGAIGQNKTKESDIVLKIGLQIKDTLEKSNEKVITTRESNEYYSLDYRSTKANKNSCDYFISLHMNSSSNKSAKGTEVWIYNNQSKLYPLASNLTENLSKSLNTLNRGVKTTTNFSVLRKTTMPALLIEIDFISNATVESECRSTEYINKVANTISATLLSFVNKTIDNNHNSNSQLYRVCIGSFTNKSNAINLKNQAISKGFKDTFIV